MRTTAPLALAAVAALTVALTACSGPAAGGGAPDPADSPLNKYMSAVWGGDLSEKEQEARFEKENKQREELIAECMAEEGFEYIPVVQNGGIVFSGDEWNPDDREWVAQYGYGMVNFPGRDDPAPTDEEWIDPNQDYVTSLSESEQQAYYETLSGPPIPEDQMNEDGSYEWNWETAGCHGYAQHEMEQQNPAMSDEFKPLMDDIQEFWTETQESDAFDEINAKWSSCMADAGHSGYDAQADAQMQFSEELNEYYENQTEWVEDDPELAELGEREIEVALADLECREKTGFRAAYSEIQFALEEEFIADHKADLDALKAAAEQGR